MICVELMVEKVSVFVGRISVQFFVIPSTSALFSVVLVCDGIDYNVVFL